jgi:hypothetical protein
MCLADSATNELAAADDPVLNPRIERGLYIGQDGDATPEGFSEDS